MRYKNFSSSPRNNPDISHLKHAKMGDYVVVYYRDGEWYAGMPMSRTDAENLASDYRTLRNTPALVHNAQQLLRMGLPEGPPRRGSPAHIGNPAHFAASFPASEKERFALWKWISKNTAGHVRGQGWYSPKNQEIVIFYKTPSARMDAILAVADHGVQGRVRSDLAPMKRAAPTKRSASAKTVTPHQAQDAAEKLGYYRTAEIIGPGGLSGANMAALVRLVEEASRKKNPYIPGDLHELDVRGLQSYTTQLMPGWSDRVRALKEQGLTHRDALARVIESHFKQRKNPATHGMSESKARQWVRDTLKIDGSAPYPGRIGPAMQAKLGWTFQVTFRNAQWGKQKGFGPEFDRWYLVGIDQDGHEFLQLTRPESIFGLRDKPSRSHR